MVGAKSPLGPFSTSSIGSLEFGLRDDPGMGSNPPFSGERSGPRSQNGFGGWALIPSFTPPGRVKENAAHRESVWVDVAQTMRLTCGIFGLIRSLSLVPSRSTRPPRPQALSGRARGSGGLAAKPPRGCATVTRHRHDFLKTRECTASTGCASVGCAARVSPQ